MATTSTRIWRSDAATSQPTNPIPITTARFTRRDAATKGISIAYRAEIEHAFEFQTGDGRPPVPHARGNEQFVVAHAPTRLEMHGPFGWLDARCVQAKKGRAWHVRRRTSVPLPLPGQCAPAFLEGSGGVVSGGAAVSWSGPFASSSALPHMEASENNDAFRLDYVEKSIREPAEQGATNIPDDHRVGLRILGHPSHALARTVQELGAEG